jgi:hypothetical protein
MLSRSTRGGVFSLFSYLKLLRAPAGERVSAGGHCLLLLLGGVNGTPFFLLIGVLGESTPCCKTPKIQVHKLSNACFDKCPQ